MYGIGKALVVGGLVILTGPLCVSVQSQDYVDVEGERAAQGSTAGDPYDPYRVKPAQQYPTTSYGASTGAAAPAAGVAASTALPATAQGQNVGNLVYQIQQLQQEVMTLNGKVEEQGYELRRLKQQLDERYLDLDRRVGGTASASVTRSTAAGSTAAGAAAGAMAASGSGRTSESADLMPPPSRAGRPQAAEQPGEGESYRAAYALVRGQQWDSAIAAFNKFLQEYPAGRYAPNAHYWLGELYLVTQPQQLESARQSFMLLLSQYPDNNKAPDAMYKLGKVYFQKGNRDRGREYFDRVIRDYGNTNNSAVQLSRDFIAENY
jgi:tol-pal system protein YbgF